MNYESAVRWVVIVVRVPAQPTRHRVAIWRELRRMGAVSLGHLVWAAPDVPFISEGLARVVELGRRSKGEVLVLDAAGRDGHDQAGLASMFTAARQQDWTDFVADCSRWDAEIDVQLRMAAFTSAELHKQEQHLDQLRRSYRDLQARDVFEAPGAAEAGQRLTQCTARLADYAERVVAALHQPEQSPGAGDPATSSTGSADLGAVDRDTANIAGH